MTLPNRVNLISPWVVSDEGRISISASLGNMQIDIECRTMLFVTYLSRPPPRRVPEATAAHE